MQGIELPKWRELGVIGGKDRSVLGLISPLK